MGALKVSFTVYPLVNALHILSIGALVTVVILMDLRVLGLAGTGIGSAPLLRLMREAVAVAFPMAVLSGLALFSIRAQEYATNSAFQTKMALLLLAGLNFWAFHRQARPIGEEPFAPAAKALAAVSIALWVSVLVAGRFIGFI